MSDYHTGDIDIDQYHTLMPEYDLEDGTVQFRTYYYAYNDVHEQLITECNVEAIRKRLAAIAPAGHGWEDGSEHIVIHLPHTGEDGSPIFREFAVIHAELEGYPILDESDVNEAIEEWCDDNRDGWLSDAEELLDGSPGSEPERHWDDMVRTYSIDLAALRAGDRDDALCELSHRMAYDYVHNS